VHAGESWTSTSIIMLLGSPLDEQGLGSLNEVF